MDLYQHPKSSHSMDSSRLSNSSGAIPNNSEVKKMDFYKQNQQSKHKKYLQETFDKVNYGQNERSLTQNFIMQQEAKRNRKDEIRQNLSNNYDEMIRLKQLRAQEQRQRTKQQQKKNLQMSTWVRDARQDSLKQKRNQHEYGKQLQMHLRLQQIQKYEQKIKERQMIEKFQREQYQQNLNYDTNQLNNFKKKQQFQKRQNEILGITQPHMLNPEGLESFRSKELEKSDMRMIKRRQQLLYGTGLEQQLRAQTISPKPNDRQEYSFEQSSRSSQKQLNDANMFNSQIYNPITNPIQINYKNPYVLRMLSQHNN